MGIKIVKMNFKFEEEAIVFFHLIHFDHLMAFYVQTGQGRRDTEVWGQAVNHADGTPKGFV